MNDLTREDVARLRALLEKATPGPWNCCDGPEGYQHRIWRDLTKTSGATVCDVANSCDAALILAMHSALPALLALAEAVAGAPANWRETPSVGAGEYSDGYNDAMRHLADEVDRLLRVEAGQG